jgi:hypothetical protein
MKKAILGLAAVGAAIAMLASVALAGNGGNTANGTGSAVSCSFGSCFAPLFNSVGDVVKYKTTGSAARIFQFADCCVAGDKYKVAIRASGSPAADTYQFTSYGTLSADCSTGPWGNQRQVQLDTGPGGTGGAKNVQVTAVALPGGAPAQAYIRMNSAGWVQSAGTDACGF